MAEVLFKKESLLNNNFTFAVTYDCNFRCPYCFEKGIQKDKTTFTKEMTDKAFQAIMQITPNEKLRPKTISLYGGEPLLKENKEAVSYIVQKGKELGFKFFAVTNGYDLDYYGDLLSPEKISGLQITIDGVKERHDSRRIHYKGYPTFDKIVNNIGLALQKGVSVVVRVNTDKDNIKDLEKLQTLFDELEYTKNKSFCIQSSLLENPLEGSLVSYNYFTQKDFIKSYSKLDMKYRCQDYGIYKMISFSMKSGKPLSFRSTFCGAQTGGYVFDSMGNVYACWEAVNQKNQCIGHYYSGNGIVWNHVALGRWKKAYLLETACMQCKYALLCSGGCPAHNVNGHHCMQMEDIVHYIVNYAYSKCKINH